MYQFNFIFLNVLDYGNEYETKGKNQTASKHFQTKEKLNPQHICCKSHTGKIKIVLFHCRFGRMVKVYEGGWINGVQQMV